MWPRAWPQSCDLLGGVFTTRPYLILFPPSYISCVLVSLSFLLKLSSNIWRSFKYLEMLFLNIKGYGTKRLRGSSEDRVGCVCVECGAHCWGIWVDVWLGNPNSQIPQGSVPNLLPGRHEPGCWGSASQVLTEGSFQCGAPSQWAGPLGPGTVRSTLSRELIIQFCQGRQKNCGFLCCFQQTSAKSLVLILLPPQVLEVPGAFVSFMGCMVYMGLPLGFLVWEFTFPVTLNLVTKHLLSSLENLVFAVSSPFLFVCTGWHPIPSHLLYHHLVTLYPFSCNQKSLCLMHTTHIYYTFIHYVCLLFSMCSFTDQATWSAGSYKDHVRNCSAAMPVTSTEEVLGNLTTHLCHHPGHTCLKWE